MRQLFLHLNNLRIVLAGVIAATFISYPLRDAVNVMNSFRLAITRNELPVADYIREIEALSGEALRRGASRLKEADDEAGNYFLKDGLRMVINKYTAENIRKIMAEQINNTY